MSGFRTRIAVTGATGYLGDRVMVRLRQRGMDATACPGRRDGLDLANRSAVKDFVMDGGFETVIHCAARVPKSSTDYTDDDAGANSLAMVDSLIAAEIPHIVFASSMTVYSADAAIPVREAAASDDLTGYAGFKRRAERAFCNARGLAATILRLPGLFGPPRRSGLLYNAAAGLASGKIPALSEPYPLWAALHVDDAADLLVRAAVTMPPCTQILNAGYAEPMSVTLTVSQLADLFGFSLPSGNAPLFQMDLSRTTEVIGAPVHTLGERLTELAALARAEHKVAYA